MPNALTRKRNDEMSGLGAAGYQATTENSATGHVGTADEVATVTAFLPGPYAAFWQRPCACRECHPPW
jgi:hypothetical protein